MYEPGVVASGTCGGEGDGSNLTWTLDSDGLLTISGTGKMADYSDDYPQWYGANIKNAVLEDGVTSVGSYAFYECASLASVTIPASVTRIDSYAFSECTSLTDVYYGGTETQWNRISIGSGNDALTGAAFHYDEYQAPGGTCGENLTWTLAGDGTLTVSGTGAMADWNLNEESYDPAPWYQMRASITSVELGDGVTSIGDYAFASCASLTKAKIPGSVTSIGREAFRSCTSLASMSISANVITLGDFAFADCAALTAISVDSANENYSSADGVLFNKDKTRLICCPAGKKGAYTVPTSVTEIRNAAFFGCAQLTSVVIPSGMKSILNQTFYSCMSLASVTIPASVTSVGLGAFYECKSLTDVYYGGTETQWAAITIAGFNQPLTDAAIHCTEVETGVTGRFENGWLVAAVTNAPAGAKLIAACYDASGRQAECRTATVTADGEIATGLTRKSGYTYKLMLVDRVTYAPLCEAWSGKA